MHSLPEILLAGACANVSSEMTQTYFKRPRKAVMVLCNSTLNKVKTQRITWIENYPLEGGVAGKETDEEGL